MLLVDILMPSLVLWDDFSKLLNGGFLIENSRLHRIWVYGMWTCIQLILMCSMMLTMMGSTMYFCVLCVLSSKSSLLASCLSYAMYPLISSRTWFFCLASWREPIERIVCVLTMTSNLLYNCAYGAYMLVLNGVSYS